MDKASSDAYHTVMIDKFQDLGLTKEHTNEQVVEIIQEKLGVSFVDMTKLLGEYLQDKCKDLAEEYKTVICYGDYSQLIESSEIIAKFFQEEAFKPDNWKLSKIHSSSDPKQPEMLELVFINKAVDEGDTMSGYVYLSFAGVIRHAFVHGDP